LTLISDLKASAGDTGINGVVTRRLTSEKITVPRRERERAGAGT